MKAIRHGEIAFIKIKSLPKGLKQSDTNTIVQGSHGNSHSFKNGKLYLKQDGQYIIGYFRAKDTTLLHNEHGKDGKAELPDGNYEIRKQSEWINSELKPVID